MSVVQDGPRETLVAAFSGAFACALAKIFAHPLETGKTWVVNKKTDERVDDVFKRLWKTGLYNGFWGKLCKSMIQKFITNFLFEGSRRGAMKVENGLRRSVGRRETSKSSLLALLVSGYLCEALSVPLVAPLEYVAAQVQMSKTRDGPMAVVLRTMREAGARGFYAGWRMYLLCAFQPMLLYPVHQRIRTYMLAGKGADAVLSANSAFWIGILSKAIAATATYPVRNFRMIVQVASNTKGSAPERLSAIADGKDKPGKQPSSPDADDSILGVFGGVLREEGLTGVYKGLSRELADGLIFGTAPTLLVKDWATSVARTVVYATKRT